MSNLTLTKDNYLDYLQRWDITPKTFVESLKKLCKVSPEFTHEPRLRIFKDGLSYESDYSYGKFVVRLRFIFFCFDDKKIRKHETLTFDLRSFSIKIATQRQINKMCGEPPPWFDHEGKLSDETRRLVWEYILTKNQLEAVK